MWAKLNNRMCGQFEYDVTCFCFCFDFVRSNGQCGCCSIVCWRRKVGVGVGGEVRLKLDVQGQRGWENFESRWTGGVGVLKIRQFSGTSYVYRP